MTTPAPGPRHPLACVDCGAPATVEALHVGADNELLSDVTACAEHAEAYLATATDVVHLNPATTWPTHACGPVPALGDFVHLDGQAWEVWDVQTGPDGGHQVTLFAENPDDDTRGRNPGDLTTIPWTAEPAEAADLVGQPAPGPGDQAGPPTTDATGRAALAAVADQANRPSQPDQARESSPMNSQQSAAAAVDPTPGYVASARADGLPDDYYTRPWQPGEGLDRDLPDHAYASPFPHDPDLCANSADCDPPAPATSWTWVPTPAEQQTIDYARDHLGDSAGPAPLQALHAGQEVLTEQRYASLELAAQGDIAGNGWAVFDLDPDDHSPVADAARAELAALNADLAADHAGDRALGLDVDGPDLTDDLGL